MSDEITPILSAVNGRAIANLVPQDEKTFIVDAVTGQKIAVIDGFFGGGGKAKIMTTEERTAITPEEGQMIFDSTLGALFVGDGATPGGTAVGGGEDDVPGYRLVSDGEFLNFNPISDIINVTGSSVTLEPDKAYKIVTTNGAVNISANPPAANKWGYEGHAEIFVAATGYAVFDTSKIVLANQLEPDSVNNCTLRFHDGMCYVSVEDHIAGYIVVSATGTTAGTLPYGITSATQEYIAFDASLNGSTIDLSGSTASAEKHLVGNGYTSTTLTGAVDCGTSKFTVANLALSDVQVTGGVMTLGDAYISSGSTVAVSGGGLAVEKVTGAGEDSVIDLCNTPTGIHLNGAHVSNVQITGGTEMGGTGLGLFNVSSGSADFTNVSFYDNVCGTGVLYVRKDAIVNVSGCTFYNYNSTSGTGAHTDIKVGSGTLNVRDCTFDRNGRIWGNFALGQVYLNGTNRLPDATITLDGKVILTSGAILDLTGNTNPTPIAPGGGITFEAGGATVLYSSGAVSGSYMMDNVTLPAGAKLTNTAVVDLGGGNVMVSSGNTMSANSCTFSGGSTSDNGGGLYVNGSATLHAVVFSGNNATGRGGGLYVDGGSATLTSCSFIDNNAQYGKDICMIDSTSVISAVDCSLGRVELGGGKPSLILAGTNSVTAIGQFGGAPRGTVTISSGASINLTSRIAPGGGITVLEGGCTVNGNAIAAGTYTSIVSSGGSAVINQ